MNVLPNELVILNDKLECAEVIPRLDTTAGAFAGNILKEACCAPEYLTGIGRNGSVLLSGR